MMSSEDSGKVWDNNDDLLIRRSHALLKEMFAATEVVIPTTFTLVNEILPPAKSVEEAKQKILDIVAAEDDSGTSLKTDDIVVEGDLREHYEKFKTGMKWVKRINEIGSKVAACEVGRAFDIIDDGISDLINAEEMYLYLVDELTGEPVQAEGWPITITTPSHVVPRLIPLMQLGMRGIAICDGIAGIAKMFGFPFWRVPKTLIKYARETVEILKQESSVEEFGVAHEEVIGGDEEQKSVRGASLREFENFMAKNDPGLKQGKIGDFAGLQRIGDPEDGAALWTVLTDRDEIEKELEVRAKQRKEEQEKAPPLLRCKSLVGDHAKGEDLLGVKEEAYAIADTIASQDLQPPFVVGVLGGWGSGKSFTYNLIEERLKQIQEYDLTDENVRKKFPYVGHLFSIWFDVWTYSKGSLWASLMYHILKDLNDQLYLESIITKDQLMEGVSVIRLLEEFTTSGERKYLAKAVKNESVQNKIRTWKSGGENITEAFINATNSNYDEQVKDLAKKKKMLQEIIFKKKQQLALKDVIEKKNTSILPEIIKELLKKSYDKYGEEHSDEQGFETVEAALNSIEEWKTNYGRLKKLLDYLRAGSMTPLGFTVFLASLILAVVLPLILDKIGAVAAAIAPALSGIFAKYQNAKEKLKLAQEEINKVASEMHLDKEHVQEALEAANKAQASEAAKKAQLHSETVDEEKQQDIVHDFTMLPLKQDYCDFRMLIT